MSDKSRQLTQAGALREHVKQLAKQCNIGPITESDVTRLVVFWRAAREAAPPATGEGWSAEQLAQRFHETYERLAPNFSYKTREASAKPWADVPQNNKLLMIAVCAEILLTLPDPPKEGK